MPVSFFVYSIKERGKWGSGVTDLVKYILDIHKAPRAPHHDIKLGNVCHCERSEAILVLLEIASSLSLLATTLQLNSTPLPSPHPSPL